MLILRYTKRKKNSSH